MSKKSITLQETAKNDFKTEIRMEDPVTGNPFEFTFEIDTGSPDALALPSYCSASFRHRIGRERRGGAGTGLSDIYSVKITKIGGISVSHPTSAIMSLSNNYKYGLIGVDLLRYMLTEIRGNPKNKEMEIEFEHL